MSLNKQTYAAFLGSWNLIAESCEYEQGDAPQSGTYGIYELADGSLSFEIVWVDKEGEKHEVRFSGIPDGEAKSFEGGELADALSVTAVSPRELTTRAFWRGKERMVAQRQLDEHGVAMRVTQLVRFENGTTLANTSIYRKRVMN